MTQLSQYLVDTDLLIFLLKNEPTVQAKVQSIGDAAIAVSAVSVAELQYGAYFSTQPEQNLTKTNILVARFVVIDVNATVAAKFGQIKADLRRQGLLIADFDLLIGATGLVTGRVLATNNQKHFQRLEAYGLVLENWKS